MADVDDDDDGEEEQHQQLSELREGETITNLGLMH